MPEKEKKLRRYHGRHMIGFASGSFADAVLKTH